MASGSTRARRSGRTAIATREQFDAAFTTIKALPPRAKPEDVAAEYLPRFVAELRGLGYVQSDIITHILSLKLGITERQIRAADRAHLADTNPRKKAGDGVGSGERGGPGEDAGKTGTGTGDSGDGKGAGSRTGTGRGAGTGGHAGLSGDRELTR